jgi:hypothetical protein
MTTASSAAEIVRLGGAGVNGRRQAGPIYQG